MQQAHLLEFFRRLVKVLDLGVMKLVLPEQRTFAGDKSGVKLLTIEAKSHKLLVEQTLRLQQQVVVLFGHILQQLKEVGAVVIERKTINGCGGQGRTHKRDTIQCGRRGHVTHIFIHRFGEGQSNTQ